MTKKSIHKKQKRISRLKICIFSAGLIFASIGGFFIYNQANLLASTSAITPSSLSTLSSKEVLGTNDFSQAFINFLRALGEWLLLWWRQKPVMSRVATTANSYAVDRLENDCATRTCALEKYRNDAPSFCTNKKYFDSPLSDGEYSGAWSDCGVFVGFIINYLGFDSKFPSHGAQKQYDYVVDNGYDTATKNLTDEQKKTYKWNFTYVESSSEVQYGDVFISKGSGTAGHSMIILANGGTSAVMASQGKQVPNRRNDISWVFKTYSQNITARLNK